LDNAQLQPIPNSRNFARAASSAPASANATAWFSSLVVNLAPEKRVTLILIVGDPHHCPLLAKNPADDH